MCKARHFFSSQYITIVIKRCSNRKPLKISNLQGLSQAECLFLRQRRYLFLRQQVGNGPDDFDSFQPGDNGQHNTGGDVEREDHNLCCGAEHGQHIGPQANQGRAEQHDCADTNAGCFNRCGEPAGGGPPVSLAQEENVEQDFQRPDYGQVGNVTEEGFREERGETNRVFCDLVAGNEPQAVRAVSEVEQLRVEIGDEDGGKTEQNFENRPGDANAVGQGDFQQAASRFFGLW